MMDKTPLNIKNLKYIIENISELGITTIIEGGAGIGKTEMLKQVVKELDLPSRFLSSYVVAEGDTQPIISPNIQNGETNTDLSSLMKDIISFSEKVDKYNKDNHKNVKGIFFHDELNILNPEDMKAILHWFNEGAIDIPFDNGQFKLNYDKVHNKKYDISNVALVSAWNDPDKGFSTANSVDPSMISRLALFHAVIDKDNFLEFAFENFDSDVYAFVKNNMEKIDGADENSQGTVSPRILEKVSDLMKKVKNEDGTFKEIDPCILRLMVDSLVKSSEITTIIMDSINDVNRISYSQLLDMESKSIKKTTDDMSVSEKVRLIKEMLTSKECLHGKQVTAWKTFIDELIEKDPDSALVYTNEIDSLSNKYDKNKLENEYPNVLLVSVAKEKGHSADPTLFNQYVDILKSTHKVFNILDSLDQTMI